MDSFRWFFKKYFRYHIGKLIALFFLAILVGVSSISILWFIKPILDNIFIEKDYKLLKIIPFVIVGVYIISGIARYLHFVLKRSLGELVVMRLRNDLYKHVLRLPIQKISDQDSGTFVTRIITDTQKIPQGIMTFIDLVREPVILFGSIATAFYADWKLSALLIISTPLIAFSISRIGTFIRRLTSDNLDKYGVIGSIMSETMQGMKIIKVFSMETFMKLRFTKKNRHLYESLVKTYKVEEISTPVVEFIGSIITALVIFVGGKWVIEGRLTQGEFITVIGALGHAQIPLKKINGANVQLQGAIAALNRVRSLLEIKTEKILKGDKISKINSKIEFKDVSFYYPNAKTPALQNINFTINKGETVAVVGPSGSGKTTIINLLLRFFETTEGQIVIDDKSINTFSTKSLRQLSGIVSQDTFLFNDTVNANVCAGQKLPREAVLDSLKHAYAENFVKELPEALATIIGDSGVKLSGGEQQRLAIARAFAKNSPFLILDEATSALDNNSEQKIQMALNDLMKNKTTLVIAHRLSTIKSADKIIVLEAGKIVQTGTHETLIKQNGLYKTLYGVAG